VCALNFARASSPLAYSHITSLRRRRGILYNSDLLSKMSFKIRTSLFILSIHRVYTAEILLGEELYRLGNELGNYVTVIGLQRRLGVRDETQTCNKNHMLKWKGRGFLVRLSGSNLKYYSMDSCCYAMTARWASVPEHFLGNGSVNTFPLQRIRKQQSRYC
jgi:hypothetical protein